MTLLKSGRYALNRKQKADGLDLLSDINDDQVSVAVFDPQYRGILDKLKYGNEGQNRAQARCSLTQMDDHTIKCFIKEIDRVLTPSGHLFLWVDKYHLCEGVSKWFEGTNLHRVDMITWNKQRMGMGHRSRCQSEYLLIFQKAPVRARGCWTDHSIPDVWNEKKPTDHTHSKPVELQKRLIAATTQDGDIVLDPASGGYSVLTACRLIERDFIGCDIEFGEDTYIEFAS